MNIYEDENAYFWKGPWKTVASRPTATTSDTCPRPSSRPTGSSWCSARRAARAASGTSGRRCSRRSAPTATRSAIWDKRTGVIDKEVAAYWREHYDLVAHPAAATGTRGSAQKLEGKLHIYVGDMDNYYLNNAVYLAEDFLKTTKDPLYGGRGGLRRPRAEHCWNGDHTRPNAISRLRYHQMFAPKIVERIAEDRAARAPT